MLKITEDKNALNFSVWVIPRASKTEIVGEYDSGLKVRIASPPVEGGANEELIRFLSEELCIAKSKCEIVRGASSRRKTISILGISKTEILALLRA